MWLPAYKNNLSLYCDLQSANKHTTFYCLFIKPFLDLKIQGKKDMYIAKYIFTEKNKIPGNKNKIRGTHITREIPNLQRLIVNKKGKTIHQ